MEHKVNSLSTFELNEAEQEAATTFTDLNITYIQNERALIAEKKLAVKVDPEDERAHIRQLIHLEGQFDFATYLLEIALRRKDELATKAEMEKQKSEEQPI